MSNKEPLLIDIRCYGVESESHCHDFHQLVLPVSGELLLEVDGVLGNVKDDYAAVITAENKHAFCANDANQFIVANVPLTWQPLINTLPAFIQLSPQLKSYINFINVSLKQASLSSLTQEHILMLLLEMMSDQLQSSRQIDKRVNLAKSFLDDNISQHVTSSQVAFASHLSIRQLSQLFKQQLGLTPLQYLREKRMKHAISLLSQTSLSIQQIAESVGYQNLSAFSDRFHQHFGRTPSYFRQLGKK